MRLSSIFLTSAILGASAFSLAGTPDLSSCDVWQQACCYTVSSRESSYDINRVVVHKTEGGSAAGAASWFANCNSQASAHYVFDKANGYCYQCVLEKDIAWQAGYSSTNSNSVGIEHSGYTGQNDVTFPCYAESGLESRSCCIYYAVPFSRSNIIGHNEVPGCGSPGGGGTGCHTDPGAGWDWTFYMSCCDPHVGGAIRDKYLALGGSRFIFGAPTTNELTCPDGVGKYNHFQNNGSIYWTSSTAAHEVHGSIRTKWSQLGWETGVCGYPTTDESTCPDGQGKYNHFSKGASIYWHPSIGTGYEVGGSIRNKWAALGWETGVCGYPITDESTCPDGQGKYNHFNKNNVSIYWSPSTPASEIQGAIKDKWASMGWERSSLGYPTSDEYTVAGTSDRRNDFQHGTLTWHAATGQVTQP